MKCWTSGAETQTQIETDLKTFIDGWKDPSEYRWVGSHVMAKYIQNYLNSNKQKSSLFHKVSSIMVVHGTQLIYASVTKIFYPTELIILCSLKFIAY